MKKTFIIISVLILFTLFNCKKDYSKNDAIMQSYYCLSIKDEMGVLSNKRNPYFLILAKNIENEITPNDSIINSIENISNEIKNKFKKHKDFIKRIKTEHQDTRFFDATIQFLDTYENLEVKTDSLVKSLINPKSEKRKEKKLSEELQKLVTNLTVEQTIYINKESDFHDDNFITQKEVDSIVNLIKN